MEAAGYSCLTALVTCFKTAVNRWTPLAIPYYHHRAHTAGGCGGLKGLNPIVGIREPGGSQAVGMHSGAFLSPKQGNLCAFLMLRAPQEKHKGKEPQPAQTC